MSPRPPPKFSDHDGYACICPPAKLLHQSGCTCGAWAAAKQDYQRAVDMHELERYGRMRRTRDFLIRPPTPPVTFRVVCDRCTHPPHGIDTCTVCGCAP